MAGSLDVNPAVLCTSPENIENEAISSYQADNRIALPIVHVDDVPKKAFSFTFI